MKNLQGFIVLGTRINQVMLLFVVYLRVQCYFVCCCCFLSADCVCEIVLWEAGQSVRFLIFIIFF